MFKTCRRIDCTGTVVTGQLKLVKVFSFYFHLHPRHSNVQFQMFARAGVPAFPLALKLNSKRLHGHDYFSGAYSYYFNDIIKFIKLNLTIVTANDGYGTCFANGTCSGLPGLLSEDKVDFTLFAIDPNFGSDVPITSTSPFIQGPIGSVLSISIQSMPKINSHTEKVDIFEIYRELSIWVVVLIVLLLLVVLLLSRIRLSNSNRRTIHQDQKLTLFALIDAIFNAKYLPSSPIQYIFFIDSTLLTFVSIMKIINNSSVNSDVIKIEPAKYYETLEQFILAAEAHQLDIYVIEGLQVQSEFLNRPEDIYRRIARVVKQQHRNRSLRILEDIIKGKSALMSTNLISTYAQSLLCTINKNSVRQMKWMDPPISESWNVLGFNTNISLPLRTLMSRTYMSLFESGLSGEFDRKSNRIIVNDLFGNIPNLLTNCLSQLTTVKSEANSFESMYNNLTLERSGLLFKMMTFAALIATLINCFECILHRFRSRLKKGQNVRRMRRHKQVACKECKLDYRFN